MDVTVDGVKIIKAGVSLARARAGDAAAFCRLTGPVLTRLLRQAAAMELKSGSCVARESLLIFQSMVH
jgi:hypothetical protein